MALEQSILKSTKKKLGLDENYDAFDQDVIDYINGAFFRLRQLGLGPPDGFQIDDDSAKWADFNTVGLDFPVLNAVKTYVNLKVRLLFDPPGLVHHVNAINDQLAELEHTLLTERELRWTAPMSAPALP